MAVIAFPSDGLSERDLTLVTAEGLRHGCTVEPLVVGGVNLMALLFSESDCWYVTRAGGRYAVHSEFGDLIADGIVLSEVLQLAFLPTGFLSGPGGQGAA